MSEKTPTGAERLIQALYEQQVDMVFGLVGGAAIPIFDALLDSKIKLIHVRHEQGATHMADGYARSTGKPGIVLVTSGPGATNTVTGLLTAQMDSVPLIIFCGQTITVGLGKDAFQEADVTGITYPLVKYSYLVTDVQAIPRVVKEAFYLATSGRPGPVLIDLPKDISSSPCTAPNVDRLRIPGYSVPGHADNDLLNQCADHLLKSKRPVIFVGHGAVISKAGEAITQLAEKIKAPIVTTLLGKGAVDETHPLHLGMIGMHGTAYANKALVDCDLILGIGVRWDDRITGKLDEFCSEAIRIHVDIDPAEFDKTVRCHLHLLGDARLVVEDLLPRVEQLYTGEWLERCALWRKQFPLIYPKDAGLRTQYILDRLNNIVGKETIFVTDVGQHQMWAAQFLKARSNRGWLSSGGAGTMGFGMPAAIGAQLGNPNHQVWAIVGDGGFQMTQAELATASIHKLPIKVLIINNRFLGMVRQWQELFFENRLSGVDLEGNPDFVTLAQAYGAKGLRIDKPEQIDNVLAEAAAYKKGPCIIEANVIKEDNVFPMIPAGAPIRDMLIEKPNNKMDKPTGST